MASPSRRSPRDLRQELAADASQFGFFQAVRLLTLSGRKRPGPRRRLPADLRFRTLATLSFPPSELAAYQPAPDAEHSVAEAPATAEMVISFMGLTGPSGALPTAYTELLLERKLRHRDSSMHAFFDIFSHRATALFYEAWSKYRFWLDVEAGERDGFTRHLLDLGGTGLGTLRRQIGDRMDMDENLFVYFAGLLSQKPMSAQSLATLIESFFGVSARIEQFVGQWMPLPESEQSRLGGQACELGVSLLAGSRVWDRQTKLRLRLGSMDARRYDALQPGGHAAAALRAVLQFALGHNLAVDVCLVLEKDAVPPASMTPDNPLRLGGNCWLGAQRRDPDDMRYALLH